MAAAPGIRELLDILAAATATTRCSALISRKHLILNRAQRASLARDRDRDQEAAPMKSMCIGESKWVVLLIGGEQAAAALAAAAAGGQTASPAARTRTTTVLRPARKRTATTTPAAPSLMEVRDFEIPARFRLRNSGVAVAAAAAAGMAARNLHGAGVRDCDLGRRLATVMKGSYPSCSGQ